MNHVYIHLKNEKKEDIYIYIYLRAQYDCYTVCLLTYVVVVLVRF